MLNAFFSVIKKCKKKAKIEVKIYGNHGKICLFEKYFFISWEILKVEIYCKIAIFYFTYCLMTSTTLTSRHFKNINGLFEGLKN